MSESSSLSSSSGRVDKSAGKVPARHFMDIPTEGMQPRKTATAMRILAAVVISVMVVAILATISLKLYQHKEEVLPEVKNYVGQRMTDAKGLWAKVDMSEFKDFIASFFTNKKYMLEVTPEGSNSLLDLFKWKKIKKFNVKITDL